MSLLPELLLLLKPKVVNAFLTYCLVSCAAAMAAPPALEQSKSGSFEILAYAFDRGNAKTFRGSWADGDPMVAFGGQSPVVIEYDIEFPVTAKCVLNIRYAAAEARPINVYLDGKSVGQGCRTATGSWNTSQAKWEKTAALNVQKGKHTIRLERGAAFPHVVALRFDL